MINEALGAQEVGPKWRTELLSYGLVCKAWSEMLDIFERVGGDAKRANVLAVALTLALKPERGHLMRSFNTFKFNVP